MAVTAQATGTLNSNVGTTPDVLASVNVAGTFTLHVDLNVMAAGDIVELRILQMVLTGGTARVAYYQRFDGAQPADGKIAISVPISNELTDSTALQFTLCQTKGSTHAYPWKILRYA